MMQLDCLFITVLYVRYGSLSRGCLVSNRQVNPAKFGETSAVKRGNPEPSPNTGKV